MAFGVVANAQDISFGAKAGLNVSNVIVSKGVYDPDSKISFHIGGLAEIKFSDKLALQPELLFSSQGFKGETVGSTMTGNYKSKLNYLNLPIMVKYFIMEGLAVEAGPQVGFLLSAKQVNETSTAGVSFSSENDIKDLMNTVDFGLNFGASYKLDFGLFFGARYNLGLTNISKNSGSITSKNGVIQISAGYMF